LFGDLAQCQDPIRGMKNVHESVKHIVVCHVIGSPFRRFVANVIRIGLGAIVAQQK